MSDGWRGGTPGGRRIVEGDDAEDRLRRRVLWSLPTGLYLLGTRDGERRNLMTLSWAMQVATRPRLLGVSVERGARSLELLRAGRAFTVCLLPRAERALVRRFAKPAVHDPVAGTLSGARYLDAPVTGAPVPEAAVAFLECTLVAELDLGSHVLVTGEVVGAGARGGPAPLEVLRMEDTRMSYGG